MFHVKFNDGYKVDIPSKIKCYDVVELISKNNISIVFKVIQSVSNKAFAAKVIPLNHLRNQKSIQTVDNEISILRSIRHQNIIRCYDAFNIKNERNEEMKVIIEEYCSQGNLLDYILKKGFKDENEKTRIMRSFFEAILYLHSKHIAHCDIKLENILIDEEFNIKICDFGYSKNFNSKYNENVNSTSIYASPELKKDGKIDFFKSDIWSIGIALYAMETKTFPYKNKSDVISNKLDIEMKNEKMKRIIMKCLQRNPKSRPNANELMNEEIVSMNKEEENRITQQIGPVTTNVSTNEVVK